MSLDYKSDEDGKIYAVIYNRQGQGAQIDYSAAGTVTPWSINAQVGLSGADQNILAELCKSRAVWFTKVITYKPPTPTTENWCQFSVRSGYDDSGNPRYSDTQLIIYRADVETADRFRLRARTSHDGNYNDFYTNDSMEIQFAPYRDFRSCQLFVVGVTGMESNTSTNIRSNGAVVIWRVVTSDGRQIYGYINGLCAGRGYSSTGRELYIMSDVIHPQLDKLKDKSDDDTPDTEPDGGWGSGENPTDNIDIPPLPNVNLNVTGSSLYALTEEQMLQFTSWLWSSDWQDTIKRLHNTPMENIINLAITDVPVGGSDATVIVGNINSNIPGLIAGRWAEVSCGTIDIREYYGTFADYEPYVRYTLYLPKVGYVSIPADIVTNNTITVVYHVELSSGEGLCYVLLTNKRNNVRYIWNTYSCKCTSDVVLSASDRSGQAIAFANAATSVATSAMTGNAIGAAAGALSGAVNVATAKIPTETRGSMGNFSALMSHKKPFLLIQATNLTKPKNYRENKGHAIYFTAELLSNLSGYVQTMDFHADFNCPADVGAEIERLLNEGVFIDE